MIRFQTVNNVSQLGFALLTERLSTPIKEFQYIVDRSTHLRSRWLNVGYLLHKVRNKEPTMRFPPLLPII